VAEEFAAAVIDNRQTPHCRVRAVPIADVTMLGGFWKPRMEANRLRGIPRLLQLLEEHGIVDNFRRVSGRKDVPRRGPLFTDSDLYKWMEAASYVLQSSNDADLDSTLDRLICDVVAAQGPDGYLNTYFVDERASERYTDFAHNHEFYCAGHLIQAAIAHYRATGKRRLLDCALRLADHLTSTFGPGKRHGFSGHPELEMAMVELYRCTRRTEYLEFARYLLDQLGFSSRTAFQGHAVRAGYACCGAADYFSETGDAPTWSALEKLWSDMAEHKVYITGGLGSRYEGESLGEPYELPNLRAYSETCAAVANAMWNWRMLAITGECRYADMLERVLYNGFLSGVSLSGETYFYINPLESSGPGEPWKGERSHERKEWYTTTCCPPNVQRTIASLPGYIYGVADDEVWIHLYQPSRLKHRLGSGTIVLEQETRYPWYGEVKLHVRKAPSGRLGIVFRVPGWTDACRASLNGRRIPNPKPGTYCTIERRWAPGDRISTSFDIPVRLVEAHPRVREDFCCCAICRGPLVFCVESVDNPGIVVQDLFLPPRPAFRFQYRPRLLGGIGTIRFNALVADQKVPLYSTRGSRNIHLKPASILAIPYYAWANRGPSSMLVWLPRADCLLPRT